MILNHALPDKSAPAAPSFGGSVSQKLVDLARKLHMNSDVRRSIFFVLMTSEVGGSTILFDFVTFY